MSISQGVSAAGPTALGAEGDAAAEGDAGTEGSRGPHA
jgi:hypothetical protein